MAAAAGGLAGSRIGDDHGQLAAVAGGNQQTYGRACRQPDGSWQIVQ